MRDVREPETGTSLDWDRIDGKRACRISAYHDPVDFVDSQARQQTREWAATTAIKMYDSLNSVHCEKFRVFCVSPQGFEP